MISTGTASMVHSKRLCPLLVDGLMFVMTCSPVGFGSLSMSNPFTSLKASSSKVGLPFVPIPPCPIAPFDRPLPFGCSNTLSLSLRLASQLVELPLHKSTVKRMGSSGKNVCRACKPDSKSFAFSEFLTARPRKARAELRYSSWAS